MLARVTSATDKTRLLVRLVSADEALEQRLLSAFATAQRFQLETTRGTLADRQRDLTSLPPPSLLICDIDPESAAEWRALESLLAHWPTRPAIILLSQTLGESAARRLLRLQIADWLPRLSSEADLVAGCEQALEPKVIGNGHRTRCLAFMSAIGGAGSTSLALAATSILAGKGKNALEKACVVDLDFQFGSVADHLDIVGNLNLAEIASAPERLDAHLFEIMLSRHGSGLTMLASPASLPPDNPVDAHFVGRLLNLAASRFEHLVIDMPHGELSWSESVARGADQFFIVTDLTVVGLRQARRMTDLLGARWGIPVDGAVIVNKSPRFGLWGGLTKKHAQEVLGTRLAGFVSDRQRLVRDAQNRGVLLSQVKRSNAVEADLRAIVTKSKEFL